MTVTRVIAPVILDGGSAGALLAMLFKLPLNELEPFKQYIFQKPPRRLDISCETNTIFAQHLFLGELSRQRQAMKFHLQRSEYLL